MPPSSAQPSHNRARWREIVELMRRPQPVTLPMIALFSIIPLYMIIGWQFIPGRTLHAPGLALDSALAVQPEWAVVYGSLFLAALLPVFVVHQQDLVRRTILAFLMIWLISYVCFLAYPTVSPRPREISGDGFFVWVLRGVYSSDHRYNCFPSLHVAQCYLTAGICYRVHRGLGAVTLAWASLVALSTVLIKQHYVLDAVGGMLLAATAYTVLLRTYPREATPESERRLAPLLAGIAFAIYGLFITVVWVVYHFR